MIVTYSPLLNTWQITAYTQIYFLKYSPEYFAL